MRADAALSLRPGSVTHNGGGRFWRTQPPYANDSVYDPDADRRDYILGDRIAGAVLDLGVAQGLGDVSDAYVPYLLDPASRPCEQISDFDGSATV